jgi:hypothetical protein
LQKTKHKKVDKFQSYNPLLVSTEILDSSRYFEFAKNLSPDLQAKKKRTQRKNDREKPV